MSIDGSAFYALTKLMDSCADPWAVCPRVVVRRSLILNRKHKPHMPDKPKTMPSSLPPTSEPMEIDARALGITLRTDEKTLNEIDQLQEEAVRAAQASKKFALR